MSKIIETAPVPSLSTTSVKNLCQQLDDNFQASHDLQSGHILMSIPLTDSFVDVLPGEQINILQQCNVLYFHEKFPNLI